MSKEKIPMKIVVPIIVVTWVLSLVSSLAIMMMTPSLFPVRREQIADGSISSEKIGSGAVITTKLADGNVTSAKILDGTVTAVDMANDSIPYGAASLGSLTTTSSTTWVDIPGMSVTMTLARKSRLLIMFSYRGWLTGSAAYSDMWGRAMINTTQVYAEMPLRDFIIGAGNWDNPPHCFMWSSEVLDPGTYIVKIQWRVYASSLIGNVYPATLAVLALPG